MSRYHCYMPKFFIVVVLSISSAYSNGITGIGNYQLGNLLQQSNIVKAEIASDGNKIYQMKPPEDVDLLTLRVNAGQQIYRISAYSTILNETECNTQLASLRNNVEKTQPELGYYALDQGEMFLHGKRIYTLECTSHAGGIRLLQDFSDESLISNP